MELSLRPHVRLTGLGNIGFRHLQGLKPLADRIRLTAHDLSPEAIERARAEWMGCKGAAGDFDPADDPADPVDLSILTTSAFGREELMLAELGRGARRILLEKVVFTLPEAFGRAQAALSAAGAVAFVNTARRLWPLHQGLAAMARETGGPVDLAISGRNLGFACNGVHFIDLLQMLSGEAEVTSREFETSAPWPSKRGGYYEVWGRALFGTPNGSKLRLEVMPGGPESHEMTVTINGRPLVIHESAGRVLDEAAIQVAAFGPAPFQSALGEAYAVPLLAGQAPRLPSLAESAEAHMALFSVLIPTFDRAGLIDERGVPIT